MLAAAAVAVSCAKEGFEDGPQTGISRFEISGTDGITDATKARLGEGYTICWEEGTDKICIFNKNDKYQYTVASSGTSTWMEGPAVPAQSTYYALYPYDESASNSTGSITTTLPQAQKAIHGQFSNIIAVAATKTKEFNFKTCVALVEVDLQTDGVSEISFRGNNGELVAGSLRLSASTSADPDPAIISGVKEVSISDGGKILEKGLYYIAIAPQTFHKGVTLTFKGPSGSAEKVTAKSVSARRSTRLRTGAVTLTLKDTDADMYLDYSDQNISGRLNPGEEKYLVYSYSGTTSLQYKLNTSGPVSIEYPDGSDQLEELFTAEGSIIKLKPTKCSGGLNANVRRLRSASYRGSEAGPVNLPVDNASLMGASQSGTCTANCYIVTSPGIYAFPLVYGNAIRGGAENTAAFAPEASGDKALTPFIGADGSPITSPYINGAGAKAVSARLEWEDVIGLVQEVRLVGDGSSSDRIVFTVPQESIREGNALISAVDADGKVVWSWHIWVCGAPAEEFQSITITNKAGNTYRMSSMNLGWVAPYDTPISYENATTRIRITHQGSGKTMDLVLVQTGAELPANIIGNCTFYQYGRKDPFVASDGTPCDPAENGSKKVWYTTSRRDTVGTRHAQLGGDIAAYIQNPTVYNLNSGGDGKYSNLWNGTQGAFSSSATSDANALPVVKTIYDPCPPGCCLPPIGAFSAFSKDNTEGDFNDGYLFYSAPGKTGQTIFFPATGSMSTSNMTSTKVFAALRNVGTGFSYWAANANNATAGFNLNCYNKGAVNFTFGSNRQYVFPIRPAIEELL